MPLQVYIPQPPDHGAFNDHLRASLDPLVELQDGSALPEPALYEVLVAGRPTHDQLTASPNLRTLVIPYAGVPPPTLALLDDLPHLAVHNLHHNAAPAAELAVTLMLAASKRVVPMDQALRRHDWSPRYVADDAMLLGGKTVLIVGYGAIGRRVGTACRGLGMEVLGIRRQPDAADTGAGIFPATQLAALLPQADVLVLCLPTTAASRDLIGAAELARLPRGAVLVNVARGPIVDERALYEALRSGQLGGAGLDVWYRYPAGVAERGRTAPTDLPFAGLDNVVLSPHRAGHCAVTEQLRAEHLARLLNAAAHGGELPDRVDREFGY